LDEHPQIQYARRVTTDRIAQLNAALTEGRQSLQSDTRTGYLLPVLHALGISPDSQLLVFSKTGVQRAYTSPRTPRALYFDESVVVGYVPGAPFIELASHDRLHGVVFYTLDQAADAPLFVRRTDCLSCHMSGDALDVPGMIVRSHSVDTDGNVLPQFASRDVNHETPHSERWGGWFVTADLAPARYAQRAHAGNITVLPGGVTSNQALIDWIDSLPETRGYPSSSSDIVALLLFDHQMHAINLLTRLNWEARVGAAASETENRSREADGSGGDSTSATVRRSVGELADYLLFVNEAPPAVPLTPRPGFATRFAARAVRDRRGRSLRELDLDRRLLRYPCSYMVYTEAFDALPAAAKQAVYRRMIDILAVSNTDSNYKHLSIDDRRAILEILIDTKPDFPRAN